jgi:hypothetical protein
MKYAPKVLADKKTLNQYKITIANEIKGGEGFWVNK